MVVGLHLSIYSPLIRLVDCLRLRVLQRGPQVVIVTHLLPLRPNKVVLFEVLIHHFALLFIPVHDLYFFFWFLLGKAAGVELPPPATSLKKLEEKGLVIATPDEPFVVGKVFPFKV